MAKIIERIELVHSLGEPADFTLPPELQGLLEERRLDAIANPEAGISWEEMKTRLLNRPC